LGAVTTLRYPVGRSQRDGASLRRVIERDTVVAVPFRAAVASPDRYRFPLRGRFNQACSVPGAPSLIVGQLGDAALEGQDGGDGGRSVALAGKSGGISQRPDVAT
jgi:hypothetical protein